MILSHLARFLSLLVCLTPRAWKNRKYGFMFSPSPFLRLFLCCSNTETPTHINICLHTKIFVCGRLHPPSPWPLPIKIKQQSLCVAVPVICEPLGYAVFPLWHLSAFWVEWTAMCRVSQHISGEGRFQVKCRLQFESESNHGSMMNDLRREDDS